MRAFALALALLVPAMAAASSLNVELVSLEAQPTIERTVQANSDSLRTAIGGAVLELMTIADQHALGVTGPPFAMRWQTRAGSISVAIGLTIRSDASRVALPKSIRAGRLPAGRAAVLVWRGRHDTLPKAHAELDAWLAANKHKPAGPRWEVFVTNPIQTPDPDAQETRIVAPLSTIAR